MSLDQSDWLAEDDPPRPQSPPTLPEPRGRNARANSPKRDTPHYPKDQKLKIAEKQSELECSNWLDGLDDNQEQAAEVIGVRGKECRQEMSFNLEGTEELKPDRDIDATWLPAQKPAGRGNRNPPQQKEKQEDPPKRGNRERNEPTQRNRGHQFNQSNRNEPNYYQRKPPYDSEQGDYQKRSYNNANRQGGYRGRGRGQGRGGYRGYGHREGQEDYGGRQQNNENTYKKRDNQQQTDETEGSRRGNRGNRNEANNNYNRYDRHYNNSSYNNQNCYNGRNYNRDRPYNNDKDQNDYRAQEKVYVEKDSKESSAFSKKPAYSEKALSQVSSTSIKSAESEKEKEPLVPKGRRCWPQSSIYVLGCRFAISFRPISEFRAKLLVIPYASLKMQYYPGNIINSSEVDYKARIVNKGEQVSSPGSIYLQKAISVGTFQGLAFLKIDEKRVDDSLKLGIKRLLAQVEKVEGPVGLESIIFPICDLLGGTETVIESLLEGLESCRRVKEVYVTTNQADCFMDATKIFQANLQEMLDDNKILIN